MTIIVTYRCRQCDKRYDETITANDPPYRFILFTVAKYDRGEPLPVSVHRCSPTMAGISDLVGASEA